MAATTAFDARSPERLVRGRNFSLIDVSNPTTPIVLGLVRAFQLQYGTETIRFTTLDGDNGIIERPPLGQGVFSRLVGPTGLPRYVCDCQVKDLQLVAGAGSCSDTPNTTYLLKQTKIEKISVSASAEDWPVSYDMTLSFRELV